MTARLVLTVDAEPLQRYVSSLVQFLDRTLEGFEGRVDSFETLAQAARLDLDRFAAVRAVEGRIVLEPSEFLREFAAAAGASEADLCAVEVHGGSRAS